MNLLDIFEGREPYQQAIDRLEARRIEDLEARMDDYAQRAREATDPAHRAALVKDFQKCKQERDSYYKVNEAGIGQDIANKTEKMARATPPTKAGTVASTVKNAAKWLAGKGGPGKEGPTYEDTNDDVDAFLKAGGKIQYGKPQKGPRHPGRSLASRHIGGGGDKMKPSRSGRAAAAVGSKPIGNIKESQKKNSEKVNENRARDLTAAVMLKRAHAAFPSAGDDAEALALYIANKEQADVTRLDQVNDREDAMIDRLSDLEMGLQKQIDTLKSKQGVDESHDAVASEEWVVSIDGRPWKTFTNAPQAMKAAQTIERKYGKKATVDSTQVEISRAYNDGQADAWFRRRFNPQYEEGTKDYQDYSDGYYNKRYTKEAVAEQNWSHDPWKSKYFAPAEIMQKVFAVKTEDKTYNIRAATEEEAVEKMEKAEPLATILSVKFVRNIMSEGNMKEIDIQLQDYHSMTPQQFKAAYGQDRDRWYAANRQVIRDKEVARRKSDMSEGATVAYVVAYFDTKTGDRGESTVSALTREEARDKIVQLMHERGYDVVVTGVRSAAKVDEGKVDYNFDAEDLKRLEKIRDLATLKTQAFALINKPSARPMKPEKVEWFKNKLESLNSPMKVIKLMYDLLLSGEGHSVIGSKASMNPNTYRQRFGEESMEEEKTRLDPKCWSGKKIGNPKTKMKGGVRVNNCVPAESVEEEWSKKYKDSINCSNPKGFSQRAHCAGRKKNEDIYTEDNEARDAVESAIIRRIMVARTDLLTKFGPEKVIDAAQAIADENSDVEEIGTSDVSAYVQQVERYLAMNY